MLSHESMTCHLATYHYTKITVVSVCVCECVREVSGSHDTLARKSVLPKLDATADRPWTL